MARDNSLEDLKALNGKIWESKRYSTNWTTDGYITVGEVKRRLTGPERKLIHRAIVEHSLIVKLYTQGNQGVGMQLRVPDTTLGIAPYPGVTYSVGDTVPIISIWEKHLFDDDPIEYRFRTWCKAHGTHQVDRAYKFFKAFAELPHNALLMGRYGFRKPYIDPVSAFHY